MNVDSEKMLAYAERLEENRNDIIALCANIQQSVDIAAQCLDSESGKRAAASLTSNLEVISKNANVSGDAQKRLIRTIRLLNDLPLTNRR